MELLKFIFYIGIIFIIFSMIWGFFMFLFNLFTQFRSKSNFETYLFKFFNTYILVSLIAMATVEFMNKPGATGGLFATIGLLTLYSYLVSRLERRKMIIQINSRVGNLGNPDPHFNMRLETLLITLSLIYFTLCLVKTQLPSNALNQWFYVAVKDIYDTPVIGWIISFIGIFFLLSTLLKAILYTSFLLARLMEILSGRKNDRNDRNNNSSSNNDEYADYEIIE